MGRNSKPKQQPKSGHAQHTKGQQQQKAAGNHKQQLKASGGVKKQQTSQKGKAVQKLTPAQQKEQHARRAGAAKALVHASGLGGAALSQLLDSTASELVEQHGIKMMRKGGNTKHQQQQQVPTAAQDSQDMQADGEPAAGHSGTETHTAPAAVQDAHAAVAAAKAAPRAADLLDSLGNWGL